MDIKTLEYMEERSKKARVLVDKIRNLKKIVENIEKANGEKRGLSVTLSDQHGSYDRESVKISNYYSAECLSDGAALKIFKQPIVDGLNSEIANLEIELVEI